MQGENEMNKLFKKENVLTIPNLLSVIRLLLIPVIIWLYYFKQNNWGAIAVLIISGITDIVDGFIARRFNMVSDLGKIIDPIADKLTQFSILLCLAFTYPKILTVGIIFAIKEFAMIIFGYMIIKRRDSVNSANWHGKLNTVVIYSTIVLLILFPNMKSICVIGLIILDCAIMIISFVLYARFYKNLLSNKKEVPI